MKTLFAVALIVLAVSASAAPWLVCDPNTGVTSYNVVGQSFAPVIQPAQPNGSLRMDVAGAAVGDTELLINGCIDNPIWGRLCSTTVPFTLQRPAPPVASGNTRLVP